MRDDSLQSGFVFTHLSRRRKKALVTWSLYAVVGPAFGLFMLSIMLRSIKQFEYFDLYWSAKAVAYIGLGLFAAVRLKRLIAVPLDRHPHVLALTRYGDPRQIVAAVDAEMGDPDVRPGQPSGAVEFSAQLAGARGHRSEVFLTPAWLVCRTGSEGKNLTIFRVEDIVLAACVPPPKNWLHFAGPFGQRWVALADRHGVYLELPLGDADATRLLAEVLARVPWATNRFEPAREHAAAAGLGQFVAEADRRREQIRLSGRTPPTSPS